MGLMSQAVRIESARRVDTGSDSYTAYTIFVVDEDVRVERRYSEFRALRRRLAHAGIEIVGFPSRGSVSASGAAAAAVAAASTSASLADNVLHERQAALQAWLQAVLAHARGAGHFETQAFLTADQRYDRGESSSVAASPSSSRSTSPVRARRSSRSRSSSPKAAAGAAVLAAAALASSVAADPDDGTTPGADVGGAGGGGDGEAGATTTTGTGRRTRGNMQRNKAGLLSTDRLNPKGQRVKNLIINATALEKKGSYDGALSNYQQLRALQVEIRRTEDHPDVLRTDKSIAACRHGKGETEAALEAYTGILKREVDLYGTDEHHEVIKTLRRIASIHHKASRYEEALSTYQRVLRIEHVLFRSDPQTKSIGITLYCLALVFIDQRDFMQALSHGRKALDIFEKKLGHTHESTTAAAALVKEANRQLSLPAKVKSKSTQES